MRIISGKFKGRTINFLSSETTRPLKDSVKENIFNILSHSKFFDINIKNSKILDLYSGVGSFGLECISRGAKEVTFVEKDKKVIQILKQNLVNLSITEKVKVIENQIQNFLNRKEEHKFDIFFLDPPFADINYLHNLKMIRKSKIYNEKHIVIIHRESKKNEDMGDIVNSLLVRDYGRSKLIFGKFLR